MPCIATPCSHKALPFSSPATPGTLDQNKEVHDLLAKWDDDMRTDWKGHHKHTIAGCTVAGCYYPPAPIVVVGNDTTVLDRFKVGCLVCCTWK